MFGNNIVNTSFTSNEAELYFENKIFGDYYCSSSGEDRTFISSIRALLYDRIPCDEWLMFIKYSLGRTNYPIDDYRAEIAQRELTTAGYPIFEVLYHTGGSIVQSALIEKLQDIPDMEYLPKVTKLFEKQFEVYCFINRKNKHTYLLVPDLDIKKWHLIQCVILAVVPWYYKEGDSVSTEEMNLLYALQKGTDDEYLQALDAIAVKIDFKTGYIKSVLAGFETRNERRKVETKSQMVDSMYSRIDDLYTQIHDYLIKIRKEETEILGLQQKINQIGEENSEIMDYFLSSKGVDLVNANGSEILFICKGYLSQFESGMARDFIQNENSILYLADPWSGSHYRNAPSKEDMKLFFNAVFIDRVLKIRMCAAYGMNIDNMECSGLAHYAYGGQYDRYMPNPHIDIHRCIGTFRQEFYECLSKFDYIGCIEAAVSSAHSINFGDNTVMSEFITNLWKTDDIGTTNSAKCVELPDGNCVTAKEAIKWLKENGGNENE